jgi:glutamate synthase (ferredoxin)
MEICDNTGFVPEDATIVGNTCLYGARGGQVFVSGKAGERFAVRNYLGHTVVEGIVDNCCEYMTRGRVVVPSKYNLLFLIVRRIMCLCIKEENRHQALHMHFFCFVSCLIFPNSLCIFFIYRVVRIVAAGMIGGLAYILDEDDTLIPKV